MKAAAAITLAAAALVVGIVLAAPWVSNWYDIYCMQTRQTVWDRHYNLMHGGAQ